MIETMKSHLNQQLQEIEESGLYKNERIITSPQRAMIDVKSGQTVLNMCANNYLGLANHPQIVAAAGAGMDQWGYGLSSVRFICGTQEIHRTLEREISEFLGTDDTILYTSCFDANGGLFETLLTEEDAVISDELNHASIIDGIRLCKAERLRFSNGNMNDLEAKLKVSQQARFRLIATDGVFSMAGTVANLQAICDLADRYDALVMIDDSHATGFFGKRGKGTHEYCGALGRVDIITSTLGKALGGASGGFTSGRQEIIDFLRQRSRPYLFSNSLAPVIVCASLKGLEMISSSTALRDKLESNTHYFRKEMVNQGFEVPVGDHPIVPIMLGDAALSQKVAHRLFAKGVYVIGFFYPVVPRGTARIRTQISAAHTREDLDLAVRAFAEVKAEFEI